MSIFNFHRDTTHVGFADEAYWNNRVEFRAVACVSARMGDYHEVERRLCGARCDAGAIVSEIKWSGVRTRDRQKDAEAALETILKLATERKLRLDVLVWNGRGRTYLDRLRAPSRNRETMHLQMMYRFLFSRVITRWRLADPTVIPYWGFAPDRQEGVDFDSVERELNLDPTLPGGAVFKVVDAKSGLNYSLQLADLLAGLAAWSHQNADNYETWLRLGKQPQQQLPARQWSNRLPLLDQFALQCQRNNLGLSLLELNPAFSGRGLWTREPDPVRQAMIFQPFAPLP